MQDLASRRLKRGACSSFIHLSPQSVHSGFKTEFPAGQNAGVSKGLRFEGVGCSLKFALQLVADIASMLECWPSQLVVISIVLEYYINKFDSSYERVSAKYPSRSIHTHS